MNRVLCSFCMLTFLVSSACGDKPFKSATARKAKTVYDTAASKAKVVYQAALKKAAAVYVKQLDKAIKEAGGSGDLDEANRISAEKRTVKGGSSKSPLDQFRIKMEGTVWMLSRSNWVRFGKKGIAVKNNGQKMVWVVTPNNTLVLQSYQSTNLYIWQIDRTFRSAKVTGFIKSKAAFPSVNRRIRR